MPLNVHGHAVLNHIVETGGTIALAELREHVARTHGRDATFYTCSVSDMSFDGLLSLLIERNKISLAGELVTVHVENLCKHSDGDDHSHVD